MKIFANLKSLWQDKIVSPAIILTILLIVFSFSFFIFHFSQLPPEVPLFYSRPWGQEQLALNWQLVILPFSALFFFILNFLLASKLYQQYPLLAQTLVWSSTIFSLLTTITLVRIIILIT